MHGVQFVAVRGDSSGGSISPSYHHRGPLLCQEEAQKAFVHHQPGCQQSKVSHHPAFKPQLLRNGNECFDPQGTASAA